MPLGHDLLRLFSNFFMLVQIHHHNISIGRVPTQVGLSSSDDLGNVGGVLVQIIHGLCELVLLLFRHSLGEVWVARTQQIFLWELYNRHVRGKKAPNMLSFTPNCFQPWCLGGLGFATIGVAKPSPAKPRSTANEGVALELPPSIGNCHQS